VLGKTRDGRNWRGKPGIEPVHFVKRLAAFSDGLLQDDEKVN